MTEGPEPTTPKSTATLSNRSTINKNNSNINGTNGANNNNNKGEYRGSNTRTKFVGESTRMLVHVFQVHGEQIKREQFRDTLDMLRIYTSKNFKKDISALSCLFCDLKRPHIKRSKELQEQKTTDADGNVVTEPPSSFDI